MDLEKNPLRFLKKSQGMASRRLPPANGSSRRSLWSSSTDTYRICFGSFFWNACLRARLRAANLPIWYRPVEEPVAARIISRWMRCENGFPEFRSLIDPEQNLWLVWYYFAATLAAVRFTSLSATLVNFSSAALSSSSVFCRVSAMSLSPSLFASVRAVPYPAIS